MVKNQVVGFFQRSQNLKGKEAVGTFPVQRFPGRTQFN